MPNQESQQFNLDELRKKEYLSKIEFIFLTRISARTIEKFISKIIHSKNAEDQNYYKRIPSNKGNGFKYLLHREKVLDWFMEKSTNEDMRNKVRMARGESVFGQVEIGSPMELLNKTVDTLQKQLEEKDAQLKAKDEQIRHLQESHKMDQLMLAKANGLEIRYLQSGDMQEANIVNPADSNKKKTGRSGFLHGLRSLFSRHKGTETKE